MGDLLDIGIKTSIGGSVYDNKKKPNDQIKYVISLLEPFAKQIDGLISGNHEWRIYKDVGIDISEHIAMVLKVPYLKHVGIITYSFSKRAYNINMFHGKGGGSVEHALATVKNMATKVHADVYLMGHVHAKGFTERQMKEVDSRNGKVNEITQKFVLTGSSLEYDESYAEQMNLQINTQGFPLIILHGDTPRKEIEVLV